METIIIDATMGVVGRIASYAAKKVLLANEVVIVNCNEAIVTGPRQALIATYKIKLSYGGTSQKGPYGSKVPERMMRRSIRGMLPWPKPRAREVFANVKCFNGVPFEFKDKEKLSFKKTMKGRYMTLSQLSKLI
ncbi:MAG: 50S ribosomal protein L13 [Nanoarchaeota archaeon]|nr:50S ribosomal protein L13 [Nanoarchaeota archaeon]